MRMHAMPIRQRNNPVRWRPLPAFCCAILMFLSSYSATTWAEHKQQKPCHNSTVEGAWGPAVAVETQSFLVRLQRTVKSNDKLQFAKLVHYPVRIFEGDQTREIDTQSQFVKMYSSTVTPAVRRAILGQRAECLFANGEGIMIGGGQVWFHKESRGDMKIISINLSAPSE